MNIEDLELGAEADDDVEDFRENQGVDNMTGNMHDAPRHTNLPTGDILLACRGNDNTKDSHEDLVDAIVLYSLCPSP
jgi:hypothetical protein